MVSDTGAAAALVLTGIGVSLDGHPILHDIDLAIGAGEIVALCGPSGSGKTTLLRAIAGLWPPDQGSLTWQGEDLANLSVHRRHFGLMFQDHALFGHRSVGDNVAFGLKMAGEAPPARRRRVAELLGLVGLEGYEERSVTTLSGGEAQRVALARALAPSPRLLLLDEPLGSLDREHREELAADLRTIINALGISAIHVTHDQDEAFTVADRLGVLLGGRIAQIGPPGQVRRHPGSATIARFLGLDNVVEPADAAILGLAVAGAVAIDPAGVAIRLGREASLARSATPEVPAEIGASRFRAGAYLHECTLPGGLMLLATYPDRLVPGTPVCLHVDRTAVIPLTRGQ